MQSDLLVWIDPAALDPLAGLGREGGRGIRKVFDAVFGDSGVALAKEPGLTAQLHGLILHAHQRHFDALVPRLPLVPLAELRGIGHPLEHQVFRFQRCDQFFAAASYRLQSVQPHRPGPTFADPRGCS